MEAYEAPAVAEAGNFTEITLGMSGPRTDGGPPPYGWRPWD
ncbi:lasso RiPP family leader peptide-containing protein [Streptomyces chrestomyceticus]